MSHVKNCICFVALSIKEGTGNRTTVIKGLETKIQAIRQKHAATIPGAMKQVVPFPIPVVMPPPHPPHNRLPHQPQRPANGSNTSDMASALTGAAIRPPTSGRVSSAAGGSGMHSPPSSREPYRDHSRDHSRDTSRDQSRDNSRDPSRDPPPPGVSQSEDPRVGAPMMREDGRREDGPWRRDSMERVDYEQNESFTGASRSGRNRGEEEYNVWGDPRGDQRRDDGWNDYFTGRGRGGPMGSGGSMSRGGSMSSGGQMGRGRLMDPVGTGRRGYTEATDRYWKC